MKNFEKMLTLNAIDIINAKIEGNVEFESLDLAMISLLLEEYKEILSNNIIESESR